MSFDGTDFASKSDKISSFPLVLPSSAGPAVVKTKLDAQV